MSSYTAPTRTQSIFNPSNFSSSSTSSYLTLSKADTRYLQLTGGTETGSVSFTSGLKTDSIATNTSSTLGLPKVSGGDTTTSTLSLKSLTVGDTLTSSSGYWNINDNGARFDNGVSCQSGTVYANKIQGASFQSTGSYFTFNSPIGDKQLSLYSPLMVNKFGNIQALVGQTYITSPGGGTVSINIASYVLAKSCSIIGIVQYNYVFVNTSTNQTNLYQLSAPITTGTPTTTNTTTATGISNLNVGLLNFTCTYVPYVQYAGTYYGGVQNFAGTTINNGLKVQGNGSSLLISVPSITSPSFTSITTTVNYSIYLFNEGSLL